MFFVWLFNGVPKGFMFFFSCFLMGFPRVSVLLQVCKGSKLILACGMGARNGWEEAKVSGWGTLLSR